MTVQLIGNKTEQDTVLAVIVPGMPTLYCRLVDKQAGVNIVASQTPMGNVAVPIPFLILAKAWSAPDDALHRVEIYNNCTIFPQTPAWWNTRTGQ